MKKLITIAAAIFAVSVFGFVSCSKSEATSAKTESKSVQAEASSDSSSGNDLSTVLEGLSELQSLDQETLNNAVSTALSTGQLTQDQLNSMIQLEDMAETVKYLNSLDAETAQKVIQQLVDSGELTQEQIDQLAEVEAAMGY